MNETKPKLHQIIIAILLPILGSLESIDWTWFTC